MLVGCGTASGPFPPIDALQLAIQGRSISPGLRWPTTSPIPPSGPSWRARLFDHVAGGRIKIEINQRYELDDAVQAHSDLEAGKTTGSSIFVI